MGIPLVYDPRYHTFESWASLMCEAYAANQLSIPTASTDWKQWAQGMKAIDIFMNESIPQPDIFSNWEEWAQQVVNAVNTPQG